jgi:hypothetical protein
MVTPLSLWSLVLFCYNDQHTRYLQRRTNRIVHDHCTGVGCRHFLGCSTFHTSQQSFDSGHFLLHWGVGQNLNHFRCDGRGCSGTFPVAIFFGFVTQCGRGIDFTRWPTHPFAFVKTFVFVFAFVGRGADAATFFVGGVRGAFDGGTFAFVVTGFVVGGVHDLVCFRNDGSFVASVVFHFVLGRTTIGTGFVGHRLLQSWGANTRKQEEIKINKFVSSTHTHTRLDQESNIPTLRGS